MSLVTTTVTRTDGATALVSPADAARTLGVSVGTLNVWRCTRRYPLPYAKIGRKVMYKLSDLENFVSSRTVGAAAE
jgi:hypothetical protein